MKIEFDLYEEMTIDQLAGKYDLTMLIVERAPSDHIHGRYYARFKDVETKNCGILESSYGNGDTAELAIRDYCKRISNKNLVVGSYKSLRTEFTTRAITPIWTEVIE